MYSFIRYKWRRIAKGRGELSDTFKKFYKGYSHRRKFFVRKIALYPISGVKFKRPTVMSNEICNYTEQGRVKIHQILEFSINNEIKHIMNKPVPNRSVEYNDNRISLFSAQYGKCAITGLELKVGNMHCHHKIPRSLGGSDKYNNLILLIKDIHLLVHSNKGETQRKILSRYNVDNKMLNKINELRYLVGNYNITDYKLS